MFYLLGLAIFLVSVGLAIINLGGNIFNFINLPSLLIIYIPLAAALTATQNWKILGVGFKAAVLPKSAVSEDMRGKAASLFRFLSKITIMASIIMFIICLMNMLFNLDFENPAAITAIGMNIAAALITLLNGLILVAAVFEPIVIILKKRGDKERK